MRAILVATLVACAADADPHELQSCGEGGGLCETDCTDSVRRDPLNRECTAVNTVGVGAFDETITELMCQIEVVNSTGRRGCCVLGFSDENPAPITRFFECVE